MNELKIPKDRVGVLVGVKGEVKKEIEKLLKVSLDISREGDIEISGESIDEYNAGIVIRAIGRGFNPKTALLLVNENYYLEIINIHDIIGGGKKKLIRMKARLIGTKGKARIYLEKLTDTNIIVYGKTVSIIGEVENVAVCRAGIEKLLKGAPHSNVYKYVIDEMKTRKIEGGS